MEAKQTPLIELLERIPQDARLVVEHDQFSSSLHPVGRLCREAAAALRAALAEQDEAAVYVPTVVSWSGGPMPFATIRVRLDETPTEYEYVPAHNTAEQAQPLTDKEILSAVGWERAEMYMQLLPNFPANEAKQETLKNARAVEAEVIRRMGVQR